MQTVCFKTWWCVDRSKWPGGPWDDEPDGYNWQCPDTQIDCVAMRGPLGQWCGYVAVGPEHPWYGVEDSRLAVSVHGGVTWSDKFGPLEHLEHLDPELWWVGFDCAHSRDEVPGMLHYILPGRHGVYRDLTYVVNEITDLKDAACRPDTVLPPEEEELEEQE